MSTEKVHFIAVGGSVMHNLALALKQKGFVVSGSDDELFEPSKSRLLSNGILTDIGWNPEKITTDLDAVIIGMHAKKDNPELIKAQELQLPIYSFPEYIYKQSIDKQRIVIAGSHGKTSVTAMVLHVLKHAKKAFDYAVGAQLDGFDTMVQLSDAPIIIIEGDEYLSSPLDDKPKFLNYHHHILVLNGIAWDHMNVFPNVDSYVSQFETLTDRTPKSGSIIYYENDALVKKMATKERTDVHLFPYKALSAKYKDGKTLLGKEKIKVPFFGEHNMVNASAAKEICARLGIKEKEFLEAISTFTGAAKRLESLGENTTDEVNIYKDFAHAPSKLKASCHAVKELFPKRKLIACIELHTFSSLNKDFLPQYNKAFDDADDAIVYINPKTLDSKGGEAISQEELSAYFGNKNIKLYHDIDELSAYLEKQSWKQSNLLLMSSGSFGGLNIEKLSESILSL